MSGSRDELKLLGLRSKALKAILDKDDRVELLRSFVAAMGNSSPLFAELFDDRTISGMCWLRDGLTSYTPERGYFLTGAIKFTIDRIASDESSHRLKDLYICCLSPKQFVASFITIGVVGVVLKMPLRQKDSLAILMNQFLETFIAEQIKVKKIFNLQDCFDAVVMGLRVEFTKTQQGKLCHFLSEEVRAKNNLVASKCRPILYNHCNPQKWRSRKPSTAKSAQVAAGAGAGAGAGLDASADVVGVATIVPKKINRKSVLITELQKYKFSDDLIEEILDDRDVALVFAKLCEDHKSGSSMAKLIDKGHTPADIVKKAFRLGAESMLVALDDPANIKKIGKKLPIYLKGERVNRSDESERTRLIKRTIDALEIRKSAFMGFVNFELTTGLLGLTITAGEEQLIQFKRSDRVLVTQLDEDYVCAFITCGLIGYLLNTSMTFSESEIGEECGAYLNDYIDAKFKKGEIFTLQECFEATVINCWDHFTKEQQTTLKKYFSREVVADMGAGAGKPITHEEPGGDESDSSVLFLDLSDEESDSVVKPASGKKSPAEIDDWLDKLMQTEEPLPMAAGKEEKEAADQPSTLDKLTLALQRIHQVSATSGVAPWKMLESKGFTAVHIAQLSEHSLDLVDSLCRLTEPLPVVGSSIELMLKGQTPQQVVDGLIQSFTESVAKKTAAVPQPPALPFLPIAPSASSASKPAVKRRERNPAKPKAKALSLQDELFLNGKEFRHRFTDVEGRKGCIARCLDRLGIHGSKFSGFIKNDSVLGVHKLYSLNTSGNLYLRFESFA